MTDRHWHDSPHTDEQLAEIQRHLHEDHGWHSWRAKQLSDRDAQERHEIHHGWAAERRRKNA